MRSRSICCASIALIAACVPQLHVAASAQKSVAGKAQLMLDSREITLHSAYAVKVDDVEGMRLGSLPQRYLVLQFTDTPLPADAIGDWAACTQLTKKGKLTAVEATIDPAKKTLRAIQLYAYSGPEEPATMNVTLTGSPDSYSLTNLKIGTDEISGTLRTTAPQQFIHFKEGTKPEKFQFDLDFRAPIRHPKPVTAILTDQQARTSPQFKALSAFYTACRSADYGAIRQAMTARKQQELDEFSKSQGKEKLLALLKMGAPSAAALPKQMSKIVVRGSKATVILKEADGTSFAAVALESGTWKYDN